MKQVVDINCDMGEAFGRWHIGDSRDEQLMPFISSANIAAGFHAGDPNLVDRTVRLALDHGVRVGAHPGYRDLQGFGRRKIAGADAEMVNDLIYQIGAVREFAARYGAPLQHVKPHGALYMELAGNENMSRLLVEYLQSVAPEAFLYCMHGSHTCRIASELGQPVVREFYADRDYDDDRRIVFSRDVGRPDPQGIKRKVVRACVEGKVRTISGADVEIEFESICFHSDTLGALEIAEQMRAGLSAEGIRIEPVSGQDAQAVRSFHEQS